MTDPTTVRQLWPRVLESLRGSKVTWAIMQDTHVVGVEGRLLQIGFANPALRDRFSGSPREETVRAALREITGVDWKIDAMVDPSAGVGARAVTPPMTSAPMAGAGAMTAGAMAAAPAAKNRTMNPASSPMASAAAGPGPGAAPRAGAGAGLGAATTESGGASSASGFGAPSSFGSAPPFAQQPPPPEEDEPDPDDEDVHDVGPTARDLLVRELGATVLEERSDAD